MAATRDNMTCAICTEVYVSPRFLPCHHSFCLSCLEQLAHRHRNIIPCPTCRARARIPPGGVSALQVNFYFTEEALERARNEGGYFMCSIHTKECVKFFCTQCDQAICISCKLTKHDGHVTEDLPKTVSRCKKTIETNMNSIKDAITRVKYKLESCKQNEKRALEKRAAVTEQIQDQYDIIVAMATEYRDKALQELKKASDTLEKYLSADTQRVQDELSSLLQLQARAQQALSSACDTEVLEVKREMTRGGISAERLREGEDGLPVHTYRPVLHADFNNYTEDHYMKTFIGLPLKLSLTTKKTVDIEWVDVAKEDVGKCMLWGRERTELSKYFMGEQEVTTLKRKACILTLMVIEDLRKTTEREYHTFHVLISFVDGMTHHFVLLFLRTNVCILYLRTLNQVYLK